ncbi:MAG: site-specific integrase [Lachnospiraceae bacterium]|nr:site-specific integrase [Lachnospiraceae bacterium]
MNEYKNRKSTSDMLLSFVNHDMITLSDVVSLSEDALINKLLQQIHPYSVFYSESDNRWHTTIADPSKVSGRKPIARKKKGDLEKFLLEHYHLQLNTETVYTFDNLYVEFMKYKEATQSKSTLDAYIKAYKRFYADAPIIMADISKIAVPSLKMWLQQVIDKYKLDYKAYSKFSVVFNQLYKYAVQMGYIDYNPFDGIIVRDLGLYNATKKKGKHKVFSRKETTDINEIAFDDFARKPYCVPLAVLFTFQTGLRIGEVVALKWSDIDYEEKTIKVCRFERVQQNYTDDFKTLTDCQHVIVDCDTKGDFGERIVDLTDDALYILQLLHDYYESEKIVSDWLFCNHQGRIHNRAMDLRIRRYCRLAGMDIEKSLHKVRSTYISMLRDAGMSFEKIAEEVGHKSVTTTMKHYSFDTLADEENKRILNRGLNIRTV